MDIPKAEAKYIRLNRSLQLAGLSLFLATIEMSIPKPMPFLKLGIANLPILLFVRQLHFRELLLLVFFKTFCYSLISGSLISYIAVFSAFSSLASSSAMWLLARLPSKYFSLLGISIIGSAFSNGAQLLLALRYFFPGTGSLLIPWSLSFGLASGVFLGLFALRFTRNSKWFQSIFLILQNSKELVQVNSPKIAPEKSKQRPFKDEPIPQKNRVREHVALQRFAFGFLSLGLMFAINKYEPVYLIFELLLFLWLNERLGYHPWWRSMLILLFVLVSFHLLLPSGKLLWQMNIPPYIHLKLTQGALERGLGKAFFLLNLIQISRFAVSPKLRLPGILGYMIQLVFSYYERLLNSPIKFRSTKPLASLDATLCYIENNLSAGEKTIPGSPGYRTDNPAHPQLQAKLKSSEGSCLSYRMFGLALLLQVFFLLLSKLYPIYNLASLYHLVGLI